MPGNPLCAKCRSWIHQPDDSWCIGCTAATELAGELQKQWAAPLRRVAHEVVISATRQVKALRNVGIGLHSQATSTASKKATAAAAAANSAGVNRAEKQEEVETEDNRGELPRRKTTTPKRAAKSEAGKAEPPSSSASEETEPEDDERAPRRRQEASPPPDPDHRPIRDSHRKPPEPEGPPPSSHKRRRSPERRGHTGHRARLSEAPWRGKDRERHSRRKHRAGRKHQRLYRLLEEPEKLVHQKKPESFWDLQETSFAGESAQC